MRTLSILLIILLLSQPVLVFCNDSEDIYTLNEQNSAKKLSVRFIGDEIDNPNFDSSYEFDDSGILRIKDVNVFYLNGVNWEVYLGENKISEREFFDITGYEYLAQTLDQYKAYPKDINRIFFIGSIVVIAAGIIITIIGLNETERHSERVYDPNLGYIVPVLTEKKPNHAILTAGLSTTAGGFIPFWVSLRNRHRMKYLGYNVYPYDFIKSIAEEYNTQVDSSFSR